jgi:hypothetical protein
MAGLPSSNKKRFRNHQWAPSLGRGTSNPPIPTLSSRQVVTRSIDIAAFCTGKREPKSGPFQSRSWTKIARQFSNVPRRTGVEMHKEHTFFEKVDEEADCALLRIDI